MVSQSSSHQWNLLGRHTNQKGTLGLLSYSWHKKKIFKYWSGFVNTFCCWLYLRVCDEAHGMDFPSTQRHELHTVVCAAATFADQRHLTIKWMCQGTGVACCLRPFLRVLRAFSNNCDSVSLQHFYLIFLCIIM